MYKKFPEPKELETMLKSKIKGQDSYIHDLVTCLWLHNQRREHYLRTGKFINNPKYNMLVIGKSGQGKTSTIQAVAKFLDIPLVIQDASQLRGSGWKGGQLSDILRDIQAVTMSENGKRRDFEFTVVVLDEIDKVFESRMPDKTFSPMYNLLKFMEGMECSTGEGAFRFQMATNNLLFICIGAFDGLEEIIKRRLTPPKTVGFCMSADKQAVEKNLLKQVTVKDLVAYGMSEQFLGRLPFITVMDEIDCAGYEEILLNSEISPVRQLDTLLRQEQGVSVSISEAAAKEISMRVKGSKLGARALHKEVLDLFKETLYQISEDRKHNVYCLEYKDGFFVRAVPGKRGMTGEEEKAPFSMSETEKNCISRIALDITEGDKNAVRAYAEDIFEPYELSGFQEYPAAGLADIYDYMTIKNSILFTAAAIMQIFLDGRREKDMLVLLNTIETISIGSEKSCELPFEPVKNEFLARLHFCTREQEKTYREIAWTVVKKYASELFRLDYSLVEDIWID